METTSVVIQHEVSGQHQASAAASPQLPSTAADDPLSAVGMADGLGPQADQHSLGALSDDIASLGLSGGFAGSACSGNGDSSTPRASSPRPPSCPVPVPEASTPKHDSAPADPDLHPDILEELLQKASPAVTDNRFSMAGTC